MILCIDIGNSRTKSAVLDEHGNIVSIDVHTDNSPDQLKKFIKAFDVKHAILSATGKKDWSLADLTIEGVKIELSHETPMPIQIVYSTPETLGRDRIAAACGAHAMFPKTNCLVLDAGTCITIDMVLSSGVYLGGNIAPGLQMRLRSMHDYTARLPLVEPEWPELAWGDSTRHALQNGAALGMLMEIEGMIQRAKDAFGAVNCVMTGGDADFLAAKSEYQIFVAPELVLQGLYQILLFNVRTLT